MSGQYSEVVREALFSSESIESVERVKDAVTEVLLLADPSARVYRTHYFNHTYSPDLVLEWPTESSQNSRAVFLRATQDARMLTEDVELAASEEPIFFQLDSAIASDEIGGGSGVSEGLSAASRSNGSLVTEVSSIEHLSASRGDDAGVGLYASSLVRGGVGVVREARATEMVAAISEGFSGAQNVDRLTTSAAVDLIESSLKPTESRKLTNVLQAVWVGSGGRPGDFPRDALDLSTTMNSDALAYLLELGEIDDEEFWERLSRSINLQVLMSLGDASESGALQSLMRFVAPRLRIKSCSVRSFQGFIQDDSSFK